MKQTGQCQTCRMCKCPFGSISTKKILFWEIKAGNKSVLGAGLGHMRIHGGLKCAVCAKYPHTANVLMCKFLEGVKDEKSGKSKSTAVALRWVYDSCSRNT